MRAEFSASARASRAGRHTIKRYKKLTREIVASIIPLRTPAGKAPISWRENRIASNESDEASVVERDDRSCIRYDHVICDDCCRTGFYADIVSLHPV
jgi:hypothetical protein